MQIRKISIDQRDVLRKRRTTLTSNVSYYNEEFDCGGCITYIVYGYKPKKPRMGVSKMEGEMSRKKHRFSDWNHKINGD